MLTISKAKSILNIVYESYSSLQDEEINFKYGSEFGVILHTLGNNTVILKESKFDYNSDFKTRMYNYLRLEFNLLDSESMFYDFLEVHALLHELGHVYYRYLEQTTSLDKEYASYKSKEYNSRKEAFLTYRNIEGERIADEFAMTCIRSKLNKIWAVMNEVTEEEAQNEIEFWRESE